MEKVQFIAYMLCMMVLVVIVLGLSLVLHLTIGKDRTDAIRVKAIEWLNEKQQQSKNRL